MSTGSHIQNSMVPTSTGKMGEDFPVKKGSGNFEHAGKVRDPGSGSFSFSAAAEIEAVLHNWLQYSVCRLCTLDIA